jgi:hypothetical protein
MGEFQVAVGVYKSGPDESGNILYILASFGGSNDAGIAREGIPDQNHVVAMENLAIKQLIALNFLVSHLPIL